jgi:Holliday junction resolvase RusA-like endonuclease
MYHLPTASLKLAQSRVPVGRLSTRRFVLGRCAPYNADAGPSFSQTICVTTSKTCRSSCRKAMTENEAAPVTVVIAGEPVAKARPRVTRRGIAYTPAHTRKFEAHGRLAAQLAMGDRAPIEAPVRLELVVELPIPDSWPGRKRALAVTGDLLPTSRPDVDNYIKAGLDCLNEIVVRDDSQVVEITARKRFSVAPKLVMTVFPLGAACSNRGASHHQSSSGCGGRQGNARRELHLDRRAKGNRDDEEFSVQRRYAQ